MDIYRRNIEALGKTHPHLVEMLEQTVVDKEKIVCSHLPSGEFLVSYKKPDGEVLTISDSHDLSGLPKKAAELLGQQDVKRIMLLLGFGLGGYPEALHASLKDNGVLIVYEAIPELFKATIEQKDLTMLLGSSRFILILGDKFEDFDFVRKFHRKIIQKKFYILKQTGCVTLNKNAYDRFRAKIAEAKKLNDSTVATGIGRGAEWADAFIKNIPIILRTPGVILLKNLFKERPVIIVSAGPSIEKNLHLLKEAKGKAVIIAVDVVVPTLLPADIIPDFILALEANRVLSRVFENNPILRFCPLICTPEVNYETITSLYPGPTFLNPAIKHRVMEWFHNSWEDKGYVPTPGGSVSHMAFAIAEYLGANVIALVGQDLSFRDKIHAGNATSLLYEETDIERLRQKNPVVKDIFGEERYTTGQFLTFRIAFEKIAKRFKGVIINATEGGIPIEGVRTMRLKDFIDEYCQVGPTNTFETVLPLSEMKTEYDLSGLIIHVCGTISSLDNVRKKAAEIIDCVMRLKALKERNMLNTSEAIRLIEKIAKREKIVEDPILNVIAPYRYRIENYIRRDDVSNDSFDALQDSLDYYGELVRVIEQGNAKLDSLLKVLSREFEVDSVLNDRTIPAMERFYRAGLIHHETGMVREAVKNFEQAAAEFSKIKEPDIKKRHWRKALNIHWMLAELYMKQHRLYEAKEIFQVLMGFAHGSLEEDVGFNEESIKCLIEACENGIALWESQQIKIRKILEKARKEYGSHLESGNFYLKVGDYDMANRAFKNAVEEDKNFIKEEQMERAIRKARLVASFFGLAQTYLAMNDKEKAIQALDKASEYVFELDVLTEDQCLEIRRLLTDLYGKCGQDKKDFSLYKSVAVV